MMIKLTFLGDIMCKASMLPLYQLADSKYDFTSIFREVSSLFAQSDFVFGNLETPISKKYDNLSKELYNFCSPYEFAKAVKSSGIDFVSTANNHCLDRGIDGINYTVDCLNEIGLYHTGVFKNKNKKPMVIDINGLKIGVMSYTYGTNAFANHVYLKKSDYWRVNLFQNQEFSNKIIRYVVNNKYLRKLYNVFLYIIKHHNYGKAPFERKEFSYSCKRALKKDIEQIKQQDCDLILMCMHTGGQYNDKATDDTKKLVDFLFSHGVNIISGAHEHVVHGGDFSMIDNGKIATYSLGNFDGVAGVYDKPFDKMAEFSIAWNVYIEKNDAAARISHSSFTVLKSIKDKEKNGGIIVVPVYNLIQNCNNKIEKQQLIDEMFEIALRFLGQDISNQGIKLEYLI